MKRPRSRLVALTILLSVLSPVALAEAQTRAVQDPQAAEALFEEASRLLQSKSFERACPLFLKSYRFDTTKPGALHALAECNARWGKNADAVERYREYIEAVKRLPPDRQAAHDDRVRAAQKQIAELSPNAPELVLALPISAPPGTRVTLDGEDIDAGSLERPRAVGAGEHRVTTQAPGGELIEQSIVIADGEKKRVELTVRSATPAAKNSQGAVSPSGGVSSRRVGAVAAVALGGASVVVGAVAGGIVFAKKPSIEDGCTARLPDSAVGCRDSESLDAAESAKTLGLVSSIALPVGAVGAALGLVLLLTEPTDAKLAGTRPWIAIHGTSAGRGGGMVSAIGVF